MQNRTVMHDILWNRHTVVEQRIKLRMNEIELEFNSDTVGKLIESAFHKILQNWIWISVDKVMTKRTQHPQLWWAKATQCT